MRPPHVGKKNTPIEPITNKGCLVIVVGNVPPAPKKSPPLYLYKNRSNGVPLSGHIFTFLRNALVDQEAPLWIRTRPPIWKSFSRTCPIFSPVMSASNTQRVISPHTLLLRSKVYTAPPCGSPPVNGYLRFIKQYDSKKNSPFFSPLLTNVRHSTKIALSQKPTITALSKLLPPPFAKDGYEWTIGESGLATRRSCGFLAAT